VAAPRFAPQCVRKGRMVQEGRIAHTRRERARERGISAASQARGGSVADLCAAAGAPCEGWACGGRASGQPAGARPEPSFDTVLL